MTAVGSPQRGGASTPKKLNLQRRSSTLSLRSARHRRRCRCLGEAGLAPSIQRPEVPAAASRTPEIGINLLERRCTGHGAGEGGFSRSSACPLHLDRRDVAADGPDATAGVAVDPVHGQRRHRIRDVPPARAVEATITASSSLGRARSETSGLDSCRVNATSSNGDRSSGGPDSARSSERGRSWPPAAGYIAELVEGLPDRYDHVVGERESSSA